MARVRRPSLADLVDLADHERAVDDLYDMPERQFDDAVEVYLRGDRRGMEVMRDPDLIERLHEALTRLRDEYRRKLRDSATPESERTRGGRMLMAIEIERRDVRPLALAARAERLADQRSEQAVKRARREEARLARALELRRQLEAASASTPRGRATKRLIKAHEAEFLRYVREEKERDADMAEAVSASR